MYGRCMGGVPMASAVPMTVKVYHFYSFQMANVLHPYTLSDPLRVAPMGTPPIVFSRLYSTDNLLHNLSQNHKENGFSAFSSRRGLGQIHDRVQSLGFWEASSTPSVKFNPQVKLS